MEGVTYGRGDLWKGQFMEGQNYVRGNLWKSQLMTKARADLSQIYLCMGPLGLLLKHL